MIDTAALRRIAEDRAPDGDSISIRPLTILSLLDRLDRYEAALREIAEVHSVHSTDSRISADLRTLAREALDRPERDG